MDTSLFFLINQGMHNPFFDFIMPFITKRADIFFVLIAIIAYLKDRKKSPLVITLCLIAFVIGDGGSHSLKHIFERPRPCRSLENVRLLVGCTGSFSMPSNHAVNAFAIAATFSHFFRKAALPMFLFAALVGFSRIYVGVHYPSDVIAGAVVGAIIAGVIIVLHKWSSVRFKEKPYTAVFFIFLLAFTFFRYYYIATGSLDLSPDEAHYWEWSRRLGLSYYSKGPFIAYIIAFTTWLMGDKVFAVRFFSPIFLAFSSIFIYKLTKEIFPSSTPLPDASGEGARERAACIAGSLIQITPLFATYGILITIDSPFIFFWTLSLYLFWKAINTEYRIQNTEHPLPNPPPSRGRAGVGGEFRTPGPELKTWLFLGLSVGFGLLAKYTMAFFYLCAFLFFIFSKEQRFWLRKKELYFSLAVSLLVFSPVIIWNAAHDWVTLKHTAGQAHVSEGFKISLKYFFEFLGSQIGVLTPLLFFAVIYGAIKDFSSRFTVHGSRFLFWFWAPVLGIYILQSFHSKVQANWAMCSYLTAFIAATGFFLKNDITEKWIRIFLSAALIMAFILTLILHYPDFLNLPVKMDLSAKLRGWRELGIKADETYNGMISSGSKKVFIFSDRYQVSSELAFYMKSKPKVYCVNLGRRMNQYDIWGGIEGNNNLSRSDALFVRMDNGGFPKELQNSFDAYEKEEFIVQKKDKILRKYFIFKCYDFKGLAVKPIKSY